MRRHAGSRKRLLATAIASVVVAVCVIGLGCGPNFDAWWTIERCDPACTNGQVCCYTFFYYVLPDGDADPNPDPEANTYTAPPISEYPDGRAMIDIRPTCGTLTVDSDFPPFNGALDGTLGHCELYPPR